MQRDTIARIKQTADCRGIFRRFWPNHFRERGNCFCPFHEDSRASLQVSRALAFCHAENLKFDAIDLYARALGTTNKEAVAEMAKELNLSGNGNGPGQMVATYDYTDAQGHLLYQSVRYDPKGFRQRRKDAGGRWVWNLAGVRRVPYRLPEVIGADTVFVVEGEKDADRLAAFGLTATTNSEGAGKWRQELCAFFGNKSVVILPDNDEPGRKHAGDVARKLLRAGAAGVRILYLPGLPEKGDVSDWIGAGGTKQKLLDLACREGVALHTALPRLDPPDAGCRTVRPRLDPPDVGASSDRDPSPDITDPVPRQIEELNRKHAIVMLGGKCTVMNEVIDPVFGRPDMTFSSPADFKTRYQNQKIFVPSGKGETKAVGVGSLWLDHRGRREYETIVFSPGRDIPGCYNLYRGLAVEPKKGCWQRLRNHIYEIICGGQERIFDYVMAWMADTVQDPGGDRPGVGIVMRGGRGVGKGIFARTFGELFGSHFLHITHQCQLTGKFNNHQKDALVVFADECFWAGDKLAEGVLKAMITEPTIRVEPKGKDSFAVKNHMRVIVASNDSWVVPAGLAERRFLVLDVIDAYRQKVGYFGPLYREIESGGKQAMLYDLLEHQYDKVSLINAPKTEALLSQIERGLEPVQRFWLDRLKEGTLLKEHVQWEQYVSSAKLYVEFQDFARGIGHTYLSSPDSFDRDLRAVCPGVQRKKRYKEKAAAYGEREWCLGFGSLDECRAKFEEALGQPVDWGGDD